MIIDNGVYDLTLFAADHPGGALALSHAAGHECTDLFVEYHPASTYKMLPSLQVAHLALSDRTTVSPLARDRRALRQKLLEDGLYESNVWWFVAVVIRSFLFFFACLILLAIAAHWPTSVTDTASVISAECTTAWWTMNPFGACLYTRIACWFSTHLYHISSPFWCRFWAAILFGLFFQQVAFIGA